MINCETNSYRATLEDGSEVIVYADNLEGGRHEAERRFGRVVNIVPAGGL